MGAKVVNNEVFENEVIKGDGVAVIDFGASWCGPCQALAPAFDKLADEFDGKAFLGKVDVDDHSELAARFNVTSVPTIVFLKGGEKVDAVTGNYPDKIRAKLESLL